MVGNPDETEGKNATCLLTRKNRHLANGKKFVEDDQSNKMTAAKKARLAKMRAPSSMRN